MATPEFTGKDGGISYSDWVIGEYHDNLICPYRVVRAFQEKKDRIKWEQADAQGEDEDLFDIREPDHWHALDVRGLNGE